jgi:GNAT superfamily N-acetyltransferase
MVEKALASKTDGWPRMHATINLRTAALEDSALIAALMCQLGYPASATEIAERIRRFAAIPSERVVVAEQECKLVGVVSVHLIPLLHATGNLGRITALVVHETVRGQGVGKQLVEDAERWAWSNDCNRIEVTSGDHRDGAHQFYQACGYTFDERRFLKTKP